MSIRWRNADGKPCKPGEGRPIVETYDPVKRKKRYVKPAEYGMSFRGLTGKALEKAAKQLDAKASEGPSPDHDETCEEFVARWLTDFPRSESTDVVYRERVSKFAVDFKGRTMRSITRTEARQWVAANPGRLGPVRTMFFDALQDRVVEDNPFAKLGQKKSKGRKDIVPLALEEVDELQRLAVEIHGEWGHEFAAWIAWAAYTMMRPGETAEARYSLLSGDVYDLQTQYHSGLRKVIEPKHGSVGAIFVPEPARKAVAEKPRPRQLKNDLIFLTKANRQFNAESLHRAWAPVRDTFTARLPESHHLRRRLAVDPKDKLDPYELRHFGASYMLNVLELEPWVVAQQLRHKDGGLLVLALYGHPDRKKAIDRMRRAFGGNVQDLHSGSGEFRGKAAGDAG